MRKGQKYSGSVPGKGIGRDRPAMLDPAQGLEGRVHDRPRRSPSGIGYEADATGIPFGSNGVVWVHREPFPSNKKSALASAIAHE